MLAIPLPVSVVNDSVSMIAEPASSATTISRAVRLGTKEPRSASSATTVNSNTRSASIHRPVASADSR